MTSPVRIFSLILLAFFFFGFFFLIDTKIGIIVLVLALIIAFLLGLLWLFVQLFFRN